MINTYSIYTLKQKNNFPLFVVEIRHEMNCSFSVFCNMNHAKSYLNDEINSLNKYAAISYDYDFKPNKKLCKLYVNADNGLFCKIANKQLYIK